VYLLEFGFPLTSRYLVEVDAKEAVCYLMTEYLPRYADAKELPSESQRRSLYKELCHVKASRRQLILSAKHDMGKIIAPAAKPPPDQYLAALFGKTKLLKQQLKDIVAAVCRQRKLLFRAKLSGKHEATDRSSGSLRSGSNCLKSSPKSQRARPASKTNRDLNRAGPRS